MKADRVRWNQKYQDESHPLEPSNVVKRFFRMAKKGRALDLACRNGRNALFLVGKGFTVDAVDISDIGLHSIPRRSEGLNLICADLDDYDIPQEKFDLIINIRHLNRRLFPYILEGLAPGGILIFETYLEEKGKKSKKISCRDHLLRSNELLHSFLPLQILYYIEKREKGGAAIASLVGVRPK
ncbi:MAG: tellurium resistance protein TehB [Desulfobacterales bacterium CG07_land_8_20_14_0_80_52_14]|nr:MAG: tellurium resistance protein TehB [Desulfobacterales bacterium CG07_land_8_20_14_0_80_52_14]